MSNEKANNQSAFDSSGPVFSLVPNEVNWVGRKGLPVSPRISGIGKGATLLEQALEEGAITGAVARTISLQGDSRFFAVPKYSSLGLSSVFDLGNLTSALFTSTLVLKLIEKRLLHFDDCVSRYCQGFGILGKGKISVRELLCHRSALPARYPFHEDLLRESQGARWGILGSRGAREYVYHAINRSSVRASSGGNSAAEYSDVGAIVLGQLIESVTGLSLDKALYNYVVKPLELRSTSYIDLSLLKRKKLRPVDDVIVATGYCPWRQRELCGEVQDATAWAMGGVAGHAGVFSSLEDVEGVVRELLKSYSREEGFLSRSILREAWERNDKSSFVSGWSTPERTPEMNTAGFDESWFGFSSENGCCLWFRPESGQACLLFVQGEQGGKRKRWSRADVLKEMRESL